MQYFVTLKFYLFVLAALITLSLIPHRYLRDGRKQWPLFLTNLIMLACLFEGYSQIGLLLLLTTAGFFIGKLLETPGRFSKILLAVAILASFLFLGEQKYQIVRNAYLVKVIRFHILSPLSLESGVPLIGISYLTFKLVHYLVEVADGSICRPKYLTFLNYIFFFPTFISGPIDRYTSFATTIAEPRVVDVSASTIVDATTRIAIGLFKKIVLATILSKHIGLLDHPEQFAGASVLNLLEAAYGFTLLLYVDFSGYSDMAIGVGRLFGVALPENFNFPLAANNIQEFWARWHITLSNWIRDYIFYPLMRLGHRTFTETSALWIGAGAITIAFTLCGIWHGDGSNFLIFGLNHGLALSALMLYRGLMRSRFKAGYKRCKDSPIYKTAGWALTIQFVVVNNLFFRLKLDPAILFVKQLRRVLVP